MKYYNNEQYSLTTAVAVLQCINVFELIENNLKFASIDRFRVVSQAGLFGSGSGLNLTKISGLIWA